MTNIPYELTKKLKESGFKMPELSASTAYIDGKDVYKAPSLSELIEACGWKMQMLYQTLVEDSGDTVWYAGTALDSKLGSGPTPEEAVAHLYLALHE